MIRRFGLRDIKLVKQLQARGVAFDLRRLLLYSRTPLESALLGLFSHGQFGSITNVISTQAHKGPVHGLVSVFLRRSMPYWDLAFLAPALDTTSQAPWVWHKLLSHLSILAATNGISRIYARAAEDPEVEELLRQDGYSVVSRAEVFVLVNRPSPVLAPRGAHCLEPQDSAALYRLYHEVVPPLVQQAEGLTPQWASMGPHHLGTSSVCKEYIWSDKNRANAYIGMRETSKANWLEIVVRPEYRAELIPLVKYVLTSSEATNSAPIYCQIPDYSIGVGWVLRALGFESYARQVTLVEHTIAHVPVKQWVLVPGLEASVDMNVPTRPALRFEEQQRGPLHGPCCN